MKVLEKSISELQGYEDFTNYVIYSNGAVINKTTNRRIAQTQCKSTGYFMVSLWNNNKRRSCTLHRLLALAFLDNPRNSTEVNHKDGNKANNDLSNLEWVSHRENLQHAVNTGLHSPKFTKRADVRKKIVCCNDGKVFESVKSASEHYHITNISSVLTGKRKTAGGLRFEYYEREAYRS